MSVRFAEKGLYVSDRLKVAVAAVPFLVALLSLAMSFDGGSTTEPEEATVVLAQNSWWPYD